jgi:hypothetical protein
MRPDAVNCIHGPPLQPKITPKKSGLRSATRLSKNDLSVGRSGEIRTRDPLLPKQVRYQAALRSARPVNGTRQLPGACSAL